MVNFVWPPPHPGFRELYAYGVFPHRFSRPSPTGNATEGNDSSVLTTHKKETPQFTAISNENGDIRTFHRAHEYEYVAAFAPSALNMNRLFLVVLWARHDPTQHTNLFA